MAVTAWLQLRLVCLEGNWYNFTQWKGFGNDTTGSFGP